MTRKSAAPRRRARDESLNLTSMIDVIFLLLIYFVTTASFAQSEGVIVAKMPREEGKPEQAGLPRLEQDLVVELAAAGSDPTGYVLSVQGSAERPTNFLELAEVLGKLQGVVHASDDCVVIRTDGQVRWQHAVDAYNAAVKAKYTNVRFERAPR